jgi:predicted site-specific integrase-resolvase
MESVIQGQLYVSPTGMISRKHAANALGVKPKTMCEWGSKGVGPLPVKVGGRIFYRWVEVEAFGQGAF